MQDVGSPPQFSGSQSAPAAAFADASEACKATLIAPAGSLEADLAVLRGHVQRMDRLMDALPPLAERDAACREMAERLREWVRSLRMRFLERHANAVYRTLTDDYRCNLRLAELADAAASCFPGLLPTAAQMACEGERIQAHKEGLDIDFGVFFSGLLSEPEAGLHMIRAMLMPTARAMALLDDFRREGRADLGTVCIERRGHAAHLTVNNPGQLNSEDNKLIDDMETAVDLALLDDQVRVAVLRGGIMTHARYAGRRIFSAGINLKQLHQGKISYIDFLLRREMSYIHKIQRGLIMPGAALLWNERIKDKPWVAAVDTFAIGGGAQLLLVFDRVIAAADSYFSLPAAQEGIVPGVANFRLGRLAGARVARQVILFGRKIWAHEIDARSLFDEVVDPAAMDAAVKTALRQLDNPAVAANRRMLNLAEEPVEQFRIYMAQFAIEQARRLFGADVLSKIARA